MSKAPEPGICERLTRTVEHTRLYHTNRTAPPIECKVDECVNPDGPEAAAIIKDLVSALERLNRNFDLLLAGKPVRDVAETKAESRAALSRAGVNR